MWIPKKTKTRYAIGYSKQRNWYLEQEIEAGIRQAQYGAELILAFANSSENSLLKVNDDYWQSKGQATLIQQENIVQFCVQYYVIDAVSIYLIDDTTRWYCKNKSKRLFPQMILDFWQELVWDYLTYEPKCSHLNFPKSNVFVDWKVDEYTYAYIQKMYQSVGIKAKKTHFLNLCYTIDCLLDKHIDELYKRYNKSVPDLTHWFVEPLFGICSFSDIETKSEMILYSKLLLPSTKDLIAEWTQLKGVRDALYESMQFSIWETVEENTVDDYLEMLANRDLTASGFLMAEIREAVWETCSMYIWNTILKTEFALD